jgi:hypothetical protein
VLLELPYLLKTLEIDMADKKVGVVVVHGIGSQGAHRPDASDKVTFSKDMHKRVMRGLGAQKGDVAWREVFWADVLQERQMGYLKKIKRKTGWDNARQLVMCNLSDAASYRQTPDGSDKTYEEIHKRVADTIRDMEGDIGPDGQIVVLAHSLGGHIMSNYIYDQQAHMRHNDGQGMHVSALQNMTTVSGIITFGCNIPVFVFSYPEEDVNPIDFPGSRLPADKHFKTWWYNFYDKQDILGYPLADTSTAYATLAKAKKLRDVPINAGGLLNAWNPLSHNAYWRDSDVTDPIIRFVQNMLR